MQSEQSEALLKTLKHIRRNLHKLSLGANRSKHRLRKPVQPLW